MFSLMTLIGAFVVGLAWGVTFVWAVTGRYWLAVIVFGGSTPVVVVTALRIIAEWGAR